MKRKYEFLVMLLVCVWAVLTLSACGGGEVDDEDDDGDGKENNEETFLSKDEVKESLKNYSFKYTYSFTEDGETSTINYIDMRTEDAWLFSTEDGDSALTFLANKSTKSLYMLHEEDMIGTILDLDNDFEGFSGWGDYLFGWYNNSDDFVKKGTTTVAGRTCSVYEFSFGTIKNKYYIDREYDICLKFETTESSSSISSLFVYTKFQMGGVKTSDIMSVLDGYEIDDYRTK